MLSRLILFAVLCLGAVVRAEEVEVEADVAAEVEEEEAAVPSDIFTAEERETIEASQETHAFQAEVTRIMDILINSLYSNREVFLRELISNAADACDKVRYQALTETDLLKEGEELGIKLEFDKERKTLTLTDQGVGMTKADLKNNLGIVAKSGTTDFIDKATNSDSLSLIGQFGVGFYSVYLVADRVTVISKHSSDDQYIWESSAGSQFTITKDPRGNTLGRGTSIVMHLKEDAEEFMDATRLTSLVGRYSQFIDFPISLKTTKTVEHEVELSEDEIAEIKAAREADKEGEEEEEEEGETDDTMEEEEEEVPTTKKVTETVDEWEVLNSAKPIWTRNPKDVEEEDYEEFYKAMTKDSSGPLDRMHFVAEGEISFRAIMYIPKTAPSGLYENYQGKSDGMKLYVRRVLISDEFDEFLPNYMNFIKGIVDSDDLPINVSRETLTQSKVLKVMAKKLTRKVLEMLRKMEERSHADEDDEDDDEGGASEDKEPVEGSMDYDEFWSQYGRSIKLGVIEDKKNANKLAKLLRFKTSKTPEGKLIGLEEYVDRMQEDQNNIFFMTCASVAACQATPLLEKFVAKGYEVIFMDEAVDEYLAMHLNEFDGLEPVNIMRENARVPGSAGAEHRLGETEDMVELKEWFTEVLGSKVDKVLVSDKLVTSPAACSASQYGHTGNMARISKAQAMQQGQDLALDSRSIFEFNPFHPIIKELNARRKADADDAQAADMARLLLDSAKLTSGYTMEEPDVFAKRIHRLVSLGLNVDPEAAVQAEPEAAEDEEQEQEEEATEEVEDLDDE